MLGLWGKPHAVYLLEICVFIIIDNHFCIINYKINILIYYYYHIYHYEQKFHIMSWGKCELLSPVKKLVDTCSH